MIFPPLSIAMFGRPASCLANVLTLCVGLSVTIDGLSAGRIEELWLLFCASASTGDATTRAGNLDAWSTAAADYFAILFASSLHISFPLLISALIQEAECFALILDPV